jgi:hypothetical protein
MLFKSTSELIIQSGKSVQILSGTNFDTVELEIEIDTLSISNIAVEYSSNTLLYTNRGNIYNLIEKDKENITTISDGGFFVSVQSPALMKVINDQIIISPINRLHGLRFINSSNGDQTEIFADLFPRVSLDGSSSVVMNNLGKYCFVSGSYYDNSSKVNYFYFFEEKFNNTYNFTVKSTSPLVPGQNLKTFSIN